AVTAGRILEKPFSPPPLVPAPPAPVPAVKPAPQAPPEAKPPITPPAPKPAPPMTVPAPVAARTTSPIAQPAPLRARAASTAIAPHHGAPPATPPRKTGFDIEEKLGTNWMAKLGITLLVFGLAFFLAHEWDQIGPAGKILIGFITSGLLMFGGIQLEKSE